MAATQKPEIGEVNTTAAALTLDGVPYRVDTAAGLDALVDEIERRIDTDPELDHPEWRSIAASWRHEAQVLRHFETFPRGTRVRLPGGRVRTVFAAVKSHLPGHVELLMEGSCHHERERVDADDAAPTDGPADPVGACQRCHTGRTPR